MFSLITLLLSPLLVKRQVLYNTESLEMLSASYKLILYLLKLNYSGPLVSACVCAKLLQLCLSLCNPINHSPPGSPVHGILQARILCPSPGDLPSPGIESTSLMFSALADELFTTSTTWEAPVPSLLIQT